MNSVLSQATIKVPALRLNRETSEIESELLERIGRVIRSGRFILGPEVEELERNFAQWIGLPHAVAVASGTDALYLALQALGLEAEEEVITTPFTFFATASAIVRHGARPVFVDIDPKSFLLDVGGIEGKITQKTRGILPVHLYGYPCPMDRIIEIAGRRNLFVLEDCAQAQGTRFRGRFVGTFGEASCFSFYPTKNLGAFGDAGLVATSSETLAKEIRMLRMHGAWKKYHHRKVGINSRLDEIQAAVLNVKFKRLEKNLRLRREKARFYEERLSPLNGKGIVLPWEDAEGESTYHQFVIRTSRRDSLLQHLLDHGIEAGVCYPLPLHLDEAFAFLGFHEGDFPGAERLAKENLALPIYPEIMVEEQSYVVEKIKEFFGK